MFDSLHRTSPVSLPRLSLAGILLAFVLAAVLATFVGVGAWSLGTSSGPSTSDLAAARSSAYAQGLNAGLDRGAVQTAKARNAAYKAGRQHGYKAGLRKGRHAGLSAGRHAGYTAGYAQGLSVGRVEGAATANASKKTSKHSH